ncbi:MAG: cupin [Deltaproteobacteria bacterium HGW-Deltaproteobacteria-14]|nr:MAG: cupin [Deltaproteobacteria bacterium HGW-Deltaproteobacteria-14]
MSLLPQTPTDLAQALVIPEGGIASRPLLEVKGGIKIVLFGLDAGQEISPHLSPFPAEVLVLKGRLDVLVGEQTWPVPANGHIDFPMGLPHGLTALEPTWFVLTMLRGAAGSHRVGPGLPTT